MVDGRFVVTGCNCRRVLAFHSNRMLQGVETKSALVATQTHRLAN